MATTSGERSPLGFGERVRQLRISQGLAQTDLAGDGLSSSYVSLLESGKRAPTVSAVAALADRLGTTERFLLTGEDPQDRERLSSASPTPKSRCATVRHATRCRTRAIKVRRNRVGGVARPCAKDSRSGVRERG